MDIFILINDLDNCNFVAGVVFSFSEKPIMQINDQTTNFVQSDLDLHCLQKEI